MRRRLLSAVESWIGQQLRTLAAAHLVPRFDFDDLDKNDWLVSNQLTVVDHATGTGQPRRPDVVVWVNGIPLAVVELKNPGSEQADIWSAHNQIQTYKNQIPTIFNYNEAVIISDGTDAKLGTVTSPWERHMPWRTIDGEDLDTDKPQLEILIKGAHKHQNQALIDELEPLCRHWQGNNRPASNRQAVC